MADGAEVSSLVRRHSVALPVGVERVVSNLDLLSESDGLPRRSALRNDGQKGTRNDSGVDCHASLEMTGEKTLAMTLKNTDVVIHCAARAHIMNDAA